MIVQHNVEVLTGDFNMALLMVVPTLRQAKLDAELISWYAFRDISVVQKKAAGMKALAKRKAAGEQAAGGQAADEAAVDAAIKIVYGTKKLESVAIISLRRQYCIRSAMTLDMWEDGAKLPEISKDDGPGYVINSYIGREQALRESLERLPPLELPQHICPATVEAADMIRGMTVRAKLIKRDEWDKTDWLWKKSGHMPLIAYFGDGKGSRSEKALAHRERAADRRGWGTTSPWRSALMQKQGKGPPPAQVERQRREWARQWQQGWWPADAPAAAAAVPAAAPAEAPANAGAPQWGWAEWGGDGDGWGWAEWQGALSAWGSAWWG